MDQSRIELEILLAEKEADLTHSWAEPLNAKLRLRRQISALEFALELFRE